MYEDCNRRSDVSGIMKPVGEMGFDVAVGSMQRFGVPMGFGGLMQHSLQPLTNINERTNCRTVSRLPR